MNKKKKRTTSTAVATARASCDCDFNHCNHDLKRNQQEKKEGVLEEGEEGNLKQERKEDTPLIFAGRLPLPGTLRLSPWLPAVAREEGDQQSTGTF